MAEAMKKTIETATGKEFKTDYFNPSSSLGRLTMRILESTMADVAAVFADPAETARLTHAGRTVEGIRSSSTFPRKVLPSGWP